MNSLLGIAWENIVVGTLGAIVVSVAIYIVSFLKNKLLERKYPIKGTYLTTFEDIEDGKIINTSALAVLSQSGRKIKGKTFIGNRIWLIDGELTSTGHLHGVYVAADPLDKGIGNLFLEIANDRSMKGLWSGYDSENNIVNSGKYTFIPILDGYVIAEAQKAHATQIVELGNKELGEGFLNYNEIINMMANKESYICKVALRDRSVLGFCLCRIVDKITICDYLHIKQSDVPNYVDCAEKIGVMKTIAVRKKIQGRGIGYALTFAAYNELITHDIQAVCSIAWKNGNNVNADGVLTAIGLYPHIEINAFWEKDSLENNFSCPVCGEPPCKCSAVLYFKAV